MSHLTTHVLDTASGRPASGLRFELYRLAAEGRQLVGAWRTNAGGRTDAPLLEGAQRIPGEYELLFDVAGWRGQDGFYGTVPVRFRIGDADANCHVPLILAPFGYSTYRGS